MIATKDHFLFVVKTTDIEETLHVATEYPVGNPIGFLAGGSAATFKKNSLDNVSESWEKYGEESSAPNLHIRSPNALFSAAAASDSVTYLTVASRESSQIEDWKNLCIKYHLHNFATEDESVKIQDSSTAIQLGTPWITDVRRDLNTFELIEEDKTIKEIPIADDEIIFDFSGT
jgi:hypothetical protein